MTNKTVTDKIRDAAYLFFAVVANPFGMILLLAMAYLSLRGVVAIMRFMLLS